MATKLFKDAMLQLSDDYIELREHFHDKVDSKKVKIEDIQDFNFKEYVDAYLGFLIVDFSEDTEIEEEIEDDQDEE